MEDSAMKAIVISVSVFVAIITISAVIIYYNTAKDIVNVTGPGVDLAVAQQQDIENILLKANNNAKVSGSEVMNIIGIYKPYHFFQLCKKVLNEFLSLI